jgi:hypothetical protein
MTEFILLAVRTPTGLVSRPPLPLFRGVETNHQTTSCVGYPVDTLIFHHVSPRCWWNRRLFVLRRRCPLSCCQTRQARLSAPRIGCPPETAGSISQVQPLVLGSPGLVSAKASEPHLDQPRRSRIGVSRMRMQPRWLKRNDSHWLQ